MLPTLNEFIEHMKAMRISLDDKIVFYDDFGTAGATRAWYFFF